MKTYRQTLITVAVFFVLIAGLITGLILSIEDRYDLGFITLIAPNQHAILVSKDKLEANLSDSCINLAQSSLQNPAAFTLEKEGRDIAYNNEYVTITGRGSPTTEAGADTTAIHYICKFKSGWLPDVSFEQAE